jgi:hypothetical protein
MAFNNGRFYFKTTRNGNLIGEFSNNASKEICTESCDLQPPSLQGANAAYSGKYYSTWQENGKPCFAELTISPKVGNIIFTLEWRGMKGTGNFDGEGMLCDDILIGDYRSV